MLKSCKKQIKTRRIIMGHFDDFDLDIIQVDSTAENETKGVTSGFWCSYITGKFV